MTELLDKEHNEFHDLAEALCHLFLPHKLFYRYYGNTPLPAPRRRSTGDGDGWKDEPSIGLQLSYFADSDDEEGIPCEIMNMSPTQTEIELTFYGNTNAPVQTWYSVEAKQLKISFVKRKH